jgi:transcriptional regulator with XRE-family HTH domain
MINPVVLFELRMQNRLTQEELGKAIGLSGQYISALEHGRQPDVRSSTLLKLADVLHCSTDKLLGRTRKAYA